MNIRPTIFFTARRYTAIGRVGQVKRFFIPDPISLDLLVMTILHRPMNDKTNMKTVICCVFVAMTEVMGNMHHF